MTASWRQIIKEEVYQLLGPEERTRPELAQRTPAEVFHDNTQELTAAKKSSYANL